MPLQPDHKEIRKAVRTLPYPAEVARAMDVHPATVYRACKGMDLKLLRDIKESDISERDVVQSLASRLPDSLVAKKLGVSPQYINQLKNDN
jgi:DNA-binding CsgD family transcriptional regulator